MPDETPAEQAENWKSAGEGITTGAVGYLTKLSWSEALTTGIADGVGRILALFYKLISPIGIGLARGIAESEDLVAPELAKIASAAASDLFGTDVPASAFQSKRDRTGRTRASDALGKGVMDTIKGQAGSLQPGEAGAQRYLGMVVNMALEGWYQGWMFEYMSSLVPYFDIGKIESFAELDDTLSQSLGLGRLSRRVLGPLVDATVVTPLRWQTNKTYRPELLSVSDSVRQFLRGRWTRERMHEELARQGWDDERIEAFINAQKKFFSASDVRAFVTHAHWTKDKGLQHLRDQGYDEDAAADAIRLEGVHRIDQLESSEASAILTAYAQRDINRSEFRGLLADAISDASERALLEELGELRQRVNVRHLSSTDAEQMVKSSVTSMLDYRRALEREGFTPEAVILKELQLRWEMDRAKSVETHRLELEATRAAEQAARAEATAARKAQVEADRALARRGDESDLERAAVRGLIPFARVEELYRARYDADTVDVLVDLLEQARAEYLAQQQAAADAKARAARRNLDVGTLERAYLDGVLTRDRLQNHPVFQQFDAGDQRILLDEFERRKQEQDAAAKTKADAKAAATHKGIDLGRYERLVRLGARTLSQYGELLASLGFNAGAIADMRQLLELDIAADAAARQLRSDNEARLRAKGLSLEQFRRAVVLGTKTDTEFDTFLAQQGFTVDARSVLLADVRAAVTDAQAARQRRDDEKARSGARTLSLARVAQAARLGIVAPMTYADRLRRDGYTDDDIAIEMELLVMEIADTQASRRRRDELEAQRATPTLSLGQVERAVKAGTAALADYRAAAATLGYSVDDTALLEATVAAELETRDAARRRREQIDQELKPRNLSIGQLEAAVKAGLKTFDDYLADLEGLGYAPEDAELLGILLFDELEAASEAGA